MHSPPLEQSLPFQIVLFSFKYYFHWSPHSLCWCWAGHRCEVPNTSCQEHNTIQQNAAGSFQSMVSVVSTNLTTVVDIQATRFMQLVGGGFAVPAQGQIFGIVSKLILCAFTFSLICFSFSSRFSSFLACLHCYIFMSELLLPPRIYTCS